MPSVASTARSCCQHIPASWPGKEGQEHILRLDPPPGMGETQNRAAAVGMKVVPGISSVSE